MGGIIAYLVNKLLLIFVYSLPMNKILLTILPFLLLATVSIHAQSSDETYALSAAELGGWVNFLASDEMKGRQNGSAEMEVAASWIAGKFTEFGIKPVYSDGQLLQPYKFNSRRGGTYHERNVVGMIEGTDPGKRDEFIIISAHFDHVGIRQAVDGDSIYNGADDNAAGTCTLLGLAKAFHKNNYQPGRTILFASVSGEEMGLHGSRHLASNMPLPAEDAYANINFEMTGHSEDLGTGNYFMTGCSFSNLDDLIQEFNKDKSFTLIDTVAMGDRLFYMSDNLAFARIEREEGVSKGIPCGTFVTTTSAKHIHTPQDEAEFFDFENMAGLVNHFAEMVLWLSHCDKDIVWTDPKFTRLEE